MYIYVENFHYVYVYVVSLFYMIRAASHQKICANSDVFGCVV